MKELRTGSHGPSPIRLQRSDDGESRVLTGLASVYGTWTSIGGRFLERVSPGAFKRVLNDPQGNDVMALFNHDPSLLLARRSAGTLRLEDSSGGLRYSADLDQRSELGRRIARLVERNELTANSFSFTIASEEWGEDEAGTITRTVTEIDRLFDVGPVSMAAYPTAKIESVRADELLAEARSAGRIRSVSFSRGEQAERLDGMLKSLKLQAQSESIHGDHRRTLQNHAALLARLKRKIA